MAERSGRIFTFPLNTALKSILSALPRSVYSAAPSDFAVRCLRCLYTARQDKHGVAFLLKRSPLTRRKCVAERDPGCWLPSRTRHKCTPYGSAVASKSFSPAPGRLFSTIPFVEAFDSAPSPHRLAL